MATFTSTIDALNTLCTSIPEWNTRLDELNGQIALRQIELARLTEDRPPTAPSVRNKGSTESLRPRDNDENPFHTSDPENLDNIQMNPFESPKSNQNEFSTPRPSSSAAKRAAAATTSPPLRASSISRSNPKPLPGALNRQSSHPTPPAQARIAPAVLRKRKTESLASGESLAPKYRTRSMIIVYYDSAVQTAFEELVKFVSGSRNSMRKGKMAAKMAEMRRAAELEVEGDDDDSGSQLEDVGPRSGMLRNDNPGISMAADSKNKFEADTDMPKLRYVSTRQMGPPRDYSRVSDNAGGAMGLGMLRGYRRGGDGAQDIFDTIDKGLEWCQSQCEHAAHQFLREGDCNTEIENIKTKLIEVKETAQKEMDKLRREEATAPAKPSRPAGVEEGKSRELKSVHMRREFGTLKDLEVDDSTEMEVDDDEGVDDLDQPALIFKRSRDIGRP